MLEITLSSGEVITGAGQRLVAATDASAATALEIADWRAHYPVIVDETYVMEYEQKTAAMFLFTLTPLAPMPRSKAISANTAARGSYVSPAIVSARRAKPAPLVFRCWPRFDFCLHINTLAADDKGIDKAVPLTELQAKETAAGRSLKLVWGHSRYSTQYVAELPADGQRHSLSQGEGAPPAELPAM